MTLFYYSTLYTSSRFSSIPKNSYLDNFLLRSNGANKKQQSPIDLPETTETLNCYKNKGQHTYIYRNRSSENKCHIDDLVQEILSFKKNNCGWICFKYNELMEEKVRKVNILKFWNFKKQFLKTFKVIEMLFCCVKYGFNMTLVRKVLCAMHCLNNATDTFNRFAKLCILKLIRKRINSEHRIRHLLFINWCNCLLLRDCLQLSR